MPADLSWIFDGLKKKGKTRSGIAKAIGRTPAAATHLLAGRRELKAREIELIASYLEVQPNNPNATKSMPKDGSSFQEMEMLLIAAKAARSALENTKIDDASARAFALSILTERLDAISSMKLSEAK